MRPDQTTTYSSCEQSGKEPLLQRWRRETRQVLVDARDFLNLGRLSGSSRICSEGEAGRASVRWPVWLWLSRSASNQRRQELVYDDFRLTRAALGKNMFHKWSRLKTIWDGSGGVGVEIATARRRRTC